MPSGRTEDLLELVRSRDLELVIPAIDRRLVRTPPLKDRRVAEPIALHVVVLHLAHALDSKRLPREVLSGAPTALATGHARHPLATGHRPLAPGVTI
jgi:hypothetical protein